MTTWSVALAAARLGESVKKGDVCIERADNDTRFRKSNGIYKRNRLGAAKGSWVIEILMYKNAGFSNDELLRNRS